MTTPSGNPFVFPGMGLGPSDDPLAGNPIMQSLEMMRRAWSNGMGGAQSLAGGLPTPLILNTEELERRIQELRAVENWLRLNLNMLQGSIQALEVQRATLATLRSFAHMGTAAAQAQGPGSPAAADKPDGDAAPSPLEVALGLKPGRGTSGSAGGAPTEQPPTAQPAAEPPPAGPEASAQASAPSPQQAWWNMLQNQFNQIASAAAATMPTDKAAAAAPASPPAPAASSAKAAPAPRKRARKAAARKSPSRKTS